MKPRRGRRPAVPHEDGPPGSTPGPGTADGTVRKPAKRPGREPGACGFDSHPCYCLGRIVPWSSGQGARPTNGRGGFDSLRDDCRRHGRLVQREDARFAAGRSGFDSPAGPLHRSDRTEGSRIRLAGPLCSRVRPRSGGVRFESLAFRMSVFALEGPPDRRRDPLGRRASLTALRVRPPPLPPS